MQQIDMQVHFQASVANVFACLSDHGFFGEVTGAQIERVVDSKTQHINGLGSVRRVKVPLSAAFEETVTAFELDQLIEYRVSKGSPIKEHLGQLRFVQTDKGCVLYYQICFTPKLAIPGWGRLLKRLIRRPIADGLARFSNDFR